MNFKKLLRRIIYRGIVLLVAVNDLLFHNDSRKTFLKNKLRRIGCYVKIVNVANE